MTALVLFFLLYIDDIAIVISNSNINLYANESKICHANGRSDNLAPSQDDLNRIAYIIVS